MSKYVSPKSLVKVCTEELYPNLKEPINDMAEYIRKKGGSTVKRLLISLPIFLLVIVGITAYNYSGTENVVGTMIIAFLVVTFTHIAAILIVLIRSMYIANILEQIAVNNKPATLFSVPYIYTTTSLEKMAVGRYNVPSVHFSPVPNQQGISDTIYMPKDYGILIYDELSAGSVYRFLTDGKRLYVLKEIEYIEDIQ